MGRFAWGRPNTFEAENRDTAPRWTNREKGVTPLKNQAPPGYRWIFVAWITLKDGTRLYARDYGKKAFRILVKA